ncbi:hypothetical protein GCM10027090_05230 [Sinomonas soli]
MPNMNLDQASYQAVKELAEREGPLIKGVVRRAVAGYAPDPVKCGPAAPGADEGARRE